MNEPLNDASNFDHWDDAWVTRSTQELRLQVAARRARDPERTHVENDLLDLIAQAKLGLHARVHVPASACDGSTDNGSGSQ